MEKISNFKNDLKTFMRSNSKNFFDLENLSEYKHCYYNGSITNMKVLKAVIKRYFYKYHILHGYITEFELVYSLLNFESKRLFIKVIGYLLLGHRKVILPLNNEAYNNSLKEIKDLEIENKNIENFSLKELKLFDLEKIGYNIKVLSSSEGILSNYIIEQYMYKSNHEQFIGANLNDYVFDLGGCFGDTALYFAEKVGEKGFVYSFEFVPRNIRIHNYNCKLNPNLKDRIKLIPQPVFSKSDVNVYFKDKTSGTIIKMKPFKDAENRVKTISIDDFFFSNSIDTVNFIKMDIEGSELSALEGAINTIKRFKPKLAICLYHSIFHYTKIPIWIHSLNLGYNIRIGHYSTQDEETICFASINTL